MYIPLEQRVDRSVLVYVKPYSVDLSMNIKQLCLDVGTDDFDRRDYLLE